MARPEFARELPRFVAEVRDIFDSEEIRLYFDHLERMAAIEDAQAANEDDDESFGDAGLARRFPGARGTGPRTSVATAQADQPPPLAEKTRERDPKGKCPRERGKGITGHFQDEVRLGIEHRGRQGLAPPVEKIAAMERGTARGAGETPCRANRAAAARDNC